MKRDYFIGLLLLITSCGHESTVSEEKMVTTENDTTIWFADKLVLGFDTFDLDMSHHLYKFSDSVVTEWYCKNDTLRPLYNIDEAGFITWQFVNDSIIAGFRAYVPYFMQQPESAGPSYILINDNEAYLDHLLVKKDSTNPVKLENAKVIIKRFELNQQTSENVLKQFENDPEAIITW